MSFQTTNQNDQQNQDNQKQVRAVRFVITEHKDTDLDNNAIRVEGVAHTRYQDNTADLHKLVIDMRADTLGMSIIDDDHRLDGNIVRTEEDVFLLHNTTEYSIVEQRDLKRDEKVPEDIVYLLDLDWWCESVRGLTALTAEVWFFFHFENYDTEAVADICCVDEEQVGNVLKGWETTVSNQPTKKDTEMINAEEFTRFYTRNLATLNKVL